MKKGFTLIELLAVIVILAIIALIATPIILGIINDARQESNERSVELYASAIRNGIVAYQLRELKSVQSGLYTSETLPFSVEYDGNVMCEIIELYEDGGIYVTGCTVNGTEVEYTHGEKQDELPGNEGILDEEKTQIYKPQYYSWLSGSIGGDLPSDAKSTVTELNPSYPFYLGIDVDSNNKIISAYACFTKNEIEYCLKGYDTEAFDTNISIIAEAFKDVVETDACSLENPEAYCGVDGWLVRAYISGYVTTGDDSGSYCYISGTSIGCYVD